MKLIKMTCPNCKSNLEVDSDKYEFICDYCRTPILLDDEIVKVEHTVIGKENVIDKEREENLKIARTYLYDFKDYDKAYKIYKELSEKYPYEPEIWIGLVISITDNFTRHTTYFSNEIMNDNVTDYFDKYIKIEKDENKKQEYIKKYEEYENYKKIRKEIKKEEMKEEVKENIIVGIVAFFLYILIVAVFIITFISII